MAQARRDHQALLLANNNTVLITGETGTGVVVAGAEQFVPWAGEFSSTASPSVARSSAVAANVAKDGVALLATGRGADAALVAGSELYGFATLKTDKDDYPPGTTVYMTGSGWQPGERVTLSYTKSGLGTLIARTTRMPTRLEESPTASSRLTSLTSACGSISLLEAQRRRRRSRSSMARLTTRQTFRLIAPHRVVPPRPHPHDQVRLGRWEQDPRLSEDLRSRGMDVSSESVSSSNGRPWTVAVVSVKSACFSQLNSGALDKGTGGNPADQVTVTFTGAAPTIGTSTPYQWLVQAWSGTAQGGGQFTGTAWTQIQPSNLTVTVAPSSVNTTTTASMRTQPTGDATVTVSATVASASGPAVNTGTVAFTVNGTSVTSGTVFRRQRIGNASAGGLQRRFVHHRSDLQSRCWFRRQQQLYAVSRSDADP